MTDKFAKLFDVGDKQVLFILEETEDEKPSVLIQTMLNGITLKMTPSWANTDEGWNFAEHYFETRDELAALNAIGVAKEQLGESND